MENTVSFLKGSFSAQRFIATTAAFQANHVASLIAFNFNRTQAGEDGVQAGWGGGDHKYDADMLPEKNLRGDFLHWAFRVTKFAPPADEIKAQFMIELKGLMDAAGVQTPTARMKREAKEATQARIEEMGKDGRWNKHTLVPVVWDGTTGQVWLGTASHSNAGRFMDLFRLTFGVDMLPVTAGRLAERAEEAGVEPAFGDAPVWCPDGYDWMGNEFTLWLLWVNETGVDIPMPLAPGFRLTLACPDGVKGTDTFTVDVPTALPEVGRALQDGRLPRSAGIVTTLDGQPVTFTLDPEAWVVTVAKVSELDDVPPGAERDVQRLEQCRELFKALDDTYEQFLAVRLGDGWAEVVEKITQWTGRVPAEVG